MSDEKGVKKMEGKKAGVISRESAEAQLEVLLDYYDIDKNDIEIEEGPEAVQTLINGLVRSIQGGRLEISLDANNKLVVRQYLKFAPGDVDEITYGIVGCNAKLAMDRVKSNKPVERQLAFMGSLSGIGREGIGRLVGVDMGTMERLSTLFSMV